MHLYYFLQDLNKLGFDKKIDIKFLAIKSYYQSFQYINDFSIFLNKKHTNINKIKNRDVCFLVKLNNNPVTIEAIIDNNLNIKITLIKMLFIKINTEVSFMKYFCINQNHFLSTNYLNIQKEMPCSEINSMSEFLNYKEKFLDNLEFL